MAKKSTKNSAAPKASKEKKVVKVLSAGQKIALKIKDGIKDGKIDMGEIQDYKGVAKDGAKKTGQMFVSKKTETGAVIELSHISTEGVKNTSTVLKLKAKNGFTQTFSGGAARAA